MSGRGETSAERTAGNQIWPDGGEQRGGAVWCGAVRPCTPGAVSLTVAAPLARPFIAVHTCRSALLHKHCTRCWPVVLLPGWPARTSTTAAARRTRFQPSPIDWRTKGQRARPLYTY